MYDILSALPALLDKHYETDEVRRPVIFAVWRRIAGQSLASHATPIDVDGSRLTVAVADRSWQRNLEQLAPEMIFKMNFIFAEPQVKFIEFVIDKKALRAVEGTKHDRAAAEAEALDQIDELLRNAADMIESDDLRRKFLLAAGSCLARRERLAAK